MLEDHDDLDPILHEDHTLGRTVTYLICTGMVMISVFTVSMVIMNNGISAAPTRLIRLVLTCILAYGIMIGSPAARWIWVGLAGFSGVLLSGAAILAMPATSLTSALIQPVAFFYVASAILLAVPSPVSRYVRYRRLLRTS